MRNNAIPATRSRVLDRAETERIHNNAIGATDGNIIAVIMTTQTGRNAANEIPTGPVPFGIVPFDATVRAQANAAIRHKPIHAGINWRSEIPGGEIESTRASALVGKVRYETIGAGELRVPMVVVTANASLRLGHWLRYDAEKRIGDHRRMRSVHS